MKDTLDMIGAEQRFNEIVAELERCDWFHLRVDTLVHPLHEGETRRRRPTIRHTYTAGEWVLTLEPDRNWHKAHPDANVEPVPWLGTTIRLVAGRELPSVDEAIQQLSTALAGGGW